jgi:hypothetical protein
MTLPRSTSRIIEIEGTRYRWMTTRREGVLHVTVQHDSGAGSLLLAYLEPHALFRREGAAAWRFSRQARMVGPGLVRRLVGHAITNGWRPSELSTRPFVIATWSGEELTRVTDGSPPEPGEIALRDVAIRAVDDLRFDLSMDPVWRRRVIESPEQARLDLPDELVDEASGARGHGLRFRAFNDGWTTEGMVVFGIESVEFSTVVMYTTNAPDWPRSLDSPATLTQPG